MSNDEKPVNPPEPYLEFQTACQVAKRRKRKCGNKSRIPGFHPVDWNQVKLPDQDTVASAEQLANAYSGKASELRSEVRVWTRGLYLFGGIATLLAAFYSAKNGTDNGLTVHDLYLLIGPAILVFSFYLSNRLDRDQMLLEQLSILWREEAERISQESGVGALLQFLDDNSKRLERSMVELADRLPPIDQRNAGMSRKKGCLRRVFTRKQ